MHCYLRKNHRIKLVQTVQAVIGVSDELGWSILLQDEMKEICREICLSRRLTADANIMYHTSINSFSLEYGYSGFRVSASPSIIS